MDFSLLDNITWHALSGAQAGFSVGAGAARRYAPAFSPIIAFADNVRPDFAALAAYCEPDEKLYTACWAGAAPRGWCIEEDSAMLQMLWEQAPPADTGGERGVARLEVAHIAQVMELVALTRPGPFGPRNIELGEYLGHFVEGRLVAMAGERMQAATLREISGVCTHPDFQGRGLAPRLVQALIRHEIARGETPFLHVMRHNVAALRMYERMGFRRHGEVPVRVVVKRAR